MEAERPFIVDRSGRHLVWDGSSQGWVEANQTEQSREQYNGMPESMSGEDPARDTEYAHNPKQDFGTFSSLPDHGIEKVPFDNYDRTGDDDYQGTGGGFLDCPQCGDRYSPPDEPVCPSCGYDARKANHFEGEGADIFPHQGPFSEREPKLNYTNQGDNGTYGHRTAEFDFSAPAAAPGTEGFDFSDPGAPGAPADGGPDDRTETHRFVIDRNGGYFVEPATFEHHEIVAKHNLEEAARGSIYRNGTADLHRAWMPFDPAEVERQLGHHMGQQSVPLNYYPGDQRVSEGNTGHGLPISPTQGYIWKGDEYGIPPEELANSVPLIYTSEHPTPDDFEKYKNTKGFITATGGALSHAVVEGRDRQMGGAVGLGADYNKAVHGAPVSIRHDGTVEFGQSDPDSLVSQYFQRTPEEWQQALQERQRKLQQYPEWVRTRGGSVFDQTNDDYAIEAMTFGTRVAASLDECPECGDVMVDRNGEKVCSNCGHVQKIIQMEATTKESVGRGGDPGSGVINNPNDPALNQGNDDPTGLEVAGGLGLSALAIPVAGAAAGVGGAAEGAGALEAGAAEAPAAESAVGDVATAAPGRLRSLLNGAKSFGKGALINQGINTLLGAGGGGAAGQQQQQKDYEGMIAHLDPRFAFWQYASDDPDSLTIGGGRIDGDDKTEEGTQGAMEDHSGSLDEFLRDLGDTGSGNYGPEQRNAIEHFNHNLPIIVELASSDEDHSDHPVIQELEHLMEAAGWGGEHHEHAEHESEHSEPMHDAHEDEHQDEAHEADKDFPKVGAAHPDGCPCGFCKNMRKNQGVDDDDGDLDDKESATHWSVMDDMSEKELAAIFAGSPSIEFPSERTATAPSMMHHEMPGMYAQPGEAGPEMTQQSAEQQCANCGTQTIGKFCHECGTPTQSGHLEQAQARVAKPAEHNPEVNPAVTQGVGEAWQNPEDNEDERAHIKEETLAEAVLGATHQGSPPITPTRVIPGPDSAIDQGQPINATDGNRLEEGKTYMMKSNQYSIPDEVKIVKLKPNSVSPTHVEVEVKHQMPNGEHFNFPNIVSLEDIENDGLTFEPIGAASPQVVQEAEHGAQPDAAPGPGQQDDLSTPTATSAFEGEGEFVDSLSEPEPVDGLIYTDTKGEPVSYGQYAASLRQQAPPHLAWLWDNVEREVEVSHRQQQMMQATAGKDFTHMEQREFINEPGDARNKDKLDLEGTHYIEDDGADDAETWFY